MGEEKQGGGGTGSQGAKKEDLEKGPEGEKAVETQKKDSPTAPTEAIPSLDDPRKS